MQKKFKEINVVTNAVEGEASSQCSLAKICYYENAKDFTVKYCGTGIVKGSWCYLKDNKDLASNRKRVTGKYFKVLEVIENYSSSFDIEEWQHEGKSDIVKNIMSKGSAILDQIDGLDKVDIITKLNGNVCIRADVAYAYGRDNKHCRYEENTVLCGNKCYLSGGSTKLITGTNFKIVKIYDDFPDNFKFSNYLNYA